MSHATRTKNICNLSGWHLIPNTYNGRVLPSVGPLHGIFPWYCFITFVRDGCRRLFYEGLEALGPLSGNVPGEMDHQRLMQSYPARALDRRLQVDWARDARESLWVLMSLRVDFGAMG